MAELVVRSDDDGRPVPGMDVDAFLPVPDAETFATAAREWLGALPALLAPTEWEEVLRNDKPPFSGKPELVWPEYDEWTEPFMAWGDIVVAPLKWNGMRTQERRVTRANLEWLAGVLTERPVSAAIHIYRVDADGTRLPGGVTISARSGLGQPGEQIPAGKLHAKDTLMWRPGANLEDAAELRDRLAQVARAVAGRPGVTGVLAGQDTAVDFTLPFSGPPQLRWEEAVLERDLIGYSWITLCPPRAVARLGGVASLRDSGAFWRVDELPGGGALLQATERANQYDQAAAEKAFEALAPALPPAQAR
jgi:hypothetical protein